GGLHRGERRADGRGEPWRPEVQLHPTGKTRVVTCPTDSAEAAYSRVPLPRATAEWRRDHRRLEWRARSWSGRWCANRTCMYRKLRCEYATIARRCRPAASSPLLRRRPDRGFGETPTRPGKMSRGGSVCRRRLPGAARRAAAPSRTEDNGEASP